ncbi:MAG: hypothetical protein EZS28_039715, partial [Streblomastix strix]
GINGIFYDGDWTIYNYRNKIIEMFDKCNSTSDKSIYAEFRVNNDFDVSRYIYMHDIIQEEFPSPENSQQIEEIKEDEVQQNKIKDIVDKQNNSYIVVPVDEVYEEETIEVSDDQLFVLQPNSTQGEDNKPVIQPSSEQEQDNPLMIISGNGKVQIDGFVIAHSNDEGKQALIETIGDSVLRLIGVTLSPNKRTKDGNGTHINPTGQSKSSPFLFAAGKQVVIINVTMEPTSFSGCSGIILNGENENTIHSLILETSTFQVPNNKNGFQSILSASNFTISIFDSIFSGFFETQPQNTIEEESCEWSTSAIHLKDGEINFGNTTFTGLGDGALFVGAGAKVTISESSQLYGNKPSGMSERMTNFQRNIVCDGEEDKKAQLNAQVESFIEKEEEEEDEEEQEEDEEYIKKIIKWILINSKTCELSGSIASASNLMFTQQIDGIDTSIQDDIGIQVVVTGKQLFGCGKMWLNISGQASTSNDEITKSYNFEEIAQDWTSDTDVTLLIPIDDVKKVGNNIQISVLAGDTAESAIPFKDSEGNAIEVVVKDVIKEDPPEDDSSEEVIPPGPIDDPDITQPTKDSKGISTGVLIGIIVGAVAVVAVIVIIIVV